MRQSSQKNIVKKCDVWYRLFFKNIYCDNNYQN